MRAAWRGSTRTLIALSALLMVGMAPPPVTMAASGDVLSVAVAGTPSFAVRLDGHDQTASSASLLIIITNTGTASGSGWNLTMSASRLATSGSPTRTLPADALSISAAGAACDAQDTACTLPTNNVTYAPLVVAGSPVKIFAAAAGTGVGMMDVSPTLRLRIPANSYKGTYTSTITLAIVSGP